MSYAGCSGMNSISDLLIPPALLTFTLGSTLLSVNMNESTNLPYVSRNITISLSYASNVFEDDTVSEFMAKLNNGISNPLNINI